jgi:hypothetical protein
VGHNFRLTQRLGCHLLIILLISFSFCLVSIPVGPEQAASTTPFLFQKKLGPEVTIANAQAERKAQAAKKQ